MQYKPPYFVLGSFVSSSYTAVMGYSFFLLVCLCRLLHLYILLLEILFLFHIELFWKILQRKFDLITFKQQSCGKFTTKILTVFLPSSVRVLSTHQYYLLHPLRPHDVRLQVWEHQDWSSHLWSNQSFHLWMLSVFAQICSIEIQKSVHGRASFFSSPCNRSVGSC